jgi:hypothetical protein
MAVLALIACACGGGPDAESAMTPSCMDGVHDLVGGFALTRSTDYTGDYAYGRLASSSGTPCAGATEAEKCQVAFESAEAFALGKSRRFLITTEADAVQLWREESVLTLLGSIDTPEEAIFFAAALGYVPDCRTRVTRVPAGFRLAPITPDGIRCGPGLVLEKGLDVLEDGSLRDPSGVATFDETGCADRP